MGEKLINPLFNVHERYNMNFLINPYRFGLMLLDTYASAEGAYSLRKLRSAYASYCIKVRRSSDNTTQDIGFVDNVLDTASLLTFTGANSGYIDTWYDQSGNGRNLTQSTTSQQPLIVSSGTINKTNNNPSIYFDPTASNYLYAATAANWKFLHYSNTSVFTVARCGTVTDPEDVYTVWATTGSVAGSRYGAYLLHDTRSSVPRDRVLLHLVQTGTVIINIQTAGDTPANAQFLASLICKPADATAAEKSALQTNNGTPRKNNTATGGVQDADPIHPLYLGMGLNSSGVGATYLKGTIQEVVLYASDKTSDRDNINSSINGFYGMY